MVDREKREGGRRLVSERLVLKGHENDEKKDKTKTEMVLVSTT